jgi:hypothetical protein
MLLSFLHLEALGYFLNDLCVKSALIQMKLNIEGDAKLSFEALRAFTSGTLKHSISYNR